MPFLVSVVMPVYNTERYVAEAIESVLAQTYTSFELIIIDDGATDGSYEICRRYSDPRVRIIRQENAGLAAARNVGIRASKGELVAFLDSDDAWEPEKLAMHTRHFAACPELGLSYSCSSYMDTQSRPFGNYLVPHLYDITSEILFVGNPVGNGSTPVVRRVALEESARRVAGKPPQYFDERLRHAEDIECWFRIACLGHWKVEGIPAPLTRYRLNPAGLSHAADRQRYFGCLSMELSRQVAPDIYARYLPRRKACREFFMARNYLFSRKPGASLSCIARALIYDPKAFGPSQALMIQSAFAQLLFPKSLYDMLEKRMFQMQGVMQKARMDRAMKAWKA